MVQSSRPGGFTSTDVLVRYMGYISTRLITNIKGPFQNTNALLLYFSPVLPHFPNHISMYGTCLLIIVIQSGPVCIMVV